jgi:hypothetical protein
MNRIKIRIIISCFLIFGVVSSAIVLLRPHVAPSLPLPSASLYAEVATVPPPAVEESSPTMIEVSTSIYTPTITILPTAPRSAVPEPTEDQSQPTLGYTATVANEEGLVVRVKPTHPGIVTKIPKGTAVQVNGWTRLKHSNILYYRIRKSPNYDADYWVIGVDEDHPNRKTLESEQNIDDKRLEVKPEEIGEE